MGVFVAKEWSISITIPVLAYTVDEPDDVVLEVTIAVGLRKGNEYT